MHVFASYGWADGSSLDVHLDDGIDDTFDPLRTSDLTAYCRDLLRNTVADVDHRDHEHKGP